MVVCQSISYVMKKSSFLIILLLSLISEIYAQSPTWQWVKSGVGQQYDYANGLVTVTFGNTYVTGCFSSDSRSWAIPKLSFRQSRLKQKTTDYRDFFLDIIRVIRG
jgi:hypothetical protein